MTVPGGPAAPTDTNGDGLYDDVNGNGRADFADMVLFFDQMQWIGANEPVPAFDYNGNERIDFADLVWLFNPPPVTPTPTVTPTAAPIVAAFTMDRTNGTAPLEVRFTSTSTGPFDDLAWTVFSGQTSFATMNGTTPTYTFQAAGTYTVALTAKNTSTNESDTVTQPVTVTAAIGDNQPYPSAHNVPCRVEAEDYDVPARLPCLLGRHRGQRGRRLPFRRSRHRGRRQQLQRRLDPPGRVPELLGRRDRRRQLHPVAARCEPRDDDESGQGLPRRRPCRPGPDRLDRRLPDLPGVRRVGPARYPRGPPRRDHRVRGSQPAELRLAEPRNGGPDRDPDADADRYGDVTPTVTAVPEAPYPTAHVLPAKIEAEHFDAGGEGVAYHDFESANLGTDRALRPGEGVDIETAGGVTDVCFVRAGEFLNYSVDTTAADNFTLSLYAANPDATTKAVRIYLDGVPAGQALIAPTGGWLTYREFSASTMLVVPEGRHVVTIAFEGVDRLNFDWLSLATWVPTATPTPTPTVTVTPTVTWTPNPENPLSITGLDLVNEWVSIRNSGDAGVNLQGYTLSNAGATRVYTFPPFALGTGATVTVRSVGGTNTGTDLYWGVGPVVWNDYRDTATLKQPDGTVISSLTRLTWS